ncbi:MAG: hypothetical protein U5R30_01070, partial [Deltaproteobacteria bacterium]|nr:hypothetical protein [Deltaproteobacteria bacterium]
RERGVSGPMPAEAFRERKKSFYLARPSGALFDYLETLFIKAGYLLPAQCSRTTHRGLIRQEQARRKMTSS